MVTFGRSNVGIPFCEKRPRIDGHESSNLGTRLFPLPIRDGVKPRRVTADTEFVASIF
jgi:hypothetical protein